MKKNRMKSINAIIFHKVLEIFIVIIFTVVSFVICASGNLLSSSKIAEAYSTNSYEFQLKFEQDSMKERNTLENNLIKGVLAIRNPNREKKNVEISMVFHNIDYKILNDISFKLNGKLSNFEKVICEEKMCRMILNRTEIDKYTNSKFDIEIINNNNNENRYFEYSFDVKEID